MTLSPNSIVSVKLNISPQPISTQDFSTLLIIGTSPVLGQDEPARFYASMEEVSMDFGASDGEYQSAEIYFSQTPQPTKLLIGRWFNKGAPSFLRGDANFQSDLSAWQAITDGSLTLTVGQTDVELTDMDFSSVTSLFDIALIINNALVAKSSNAKIAFDAQTFSLFSGSTTEPIQPLSTASAGTFIGDSLGLGSNATAIPPLAQEDPLDAVLRIALSRGDFYMIAFGTTEVISDEQYIAIAEWVESLEHKRLIGITIQDKNALIITNTTDLPSQLSAKGFSHTITLYSASSPYAICGLFGIMTRVDFNAPNSTITLKFKTITGVSPDNLTSNQAQALTSKYCNMYASYGDFSIIQEGVVSSGDFIDNTYNLDWVCNTIAISVLNVLYQSVTKIPQTNEGVAVLVNTITSVCARARANGMIDAGVWNGQTFGDLKKGDTVPLGYYVYAVPLSQQSMEDRAKRIAPPIIVALKLAGAVHFVNITINVDR